MSLPALHQTYAQAVPELSVPHRADTPPAPRIVHLNEQLAIELGLDPEELRTPDGIAWLTGQGPVGPTPDPTPGPGTTTSAETTNNSGSTNSSGTTARAQTPTTTAQAYAGHQFGSAVPMLGDGRAVLLGDFLDTRAARRELHLKGAGRTPFARPGADGKAPLGPMLRELVVGEALHYQGIPTSRVLAVLTTGEKIQARRGIRPETGALAVRVAASHLRVGTLQLASWSYEPTVLETLVNHAIHRHHPYLAALPAPEQALGLLGAVATAQAELIAQWMAAGFVHGVMNTDNMTLSGEGIDYGPCAFLDVHRAGAVFSSIDTGGRYAYRNQPGIALWNLSRCAEALLPVIDAENPEAAVEKATAVLEAFEPQFLLAWARQMAARLGIHVGADTEPATLSRLEEVRALAADLFTLMEKVQADHTLTLRALAEEGGKSGNDEDAEDAEEAGTTRAAGSAECAGNTGVAGETALAALHADAAWPAWRDRWQALRGTGPAADAAAAEMTRRNPVYIPRNAHLERALMHAEAGDLEPVERILTAVRDPYTHHGGLEDLETAGEGSEQIVTFCGT